jgi:hypothetical protein
LDFTEGIGVVGHWRVKFISFFFILRKFILEKFTYLKDLLSENKKEGVKLVEVEKGNFCSFSGVTQLLKLPLPTPFLRLKYCSVVREN